MKNIKLICLMLALASALYGCGDAHIVGTSVDDNKIHISMSFWEPGAKNELKNAFTEIIRDYERVRPDVEIELLTQPVQRYSDWIMERQAESDLPTIMYNEKANILKMDNAGLIYYLDEALQGPNQYQNNTVWSEIFDAQKLSYTYNESGELGMAIPLSALGLAIYYNKNIYNECGLSVPDTWNEFLENCKVIESIGINPIAFMAQKMDAVNWLQWAICTNAFGKLFFDDERINTDNNKVISQKEMANAIRIGAYDITAEPYRSVYNQYLSMVRDYSRYAHDAIGLDEDGAKEQFINGRAAHIFTGNWEMKNLLKNDELDFKAGVMPFPEFTQENTLYGGERFTIRTAACLAVTKLKEAAQITPEQEAAIDFLKFLTSKQEYSKYAENTGTIPTVKGVETDGDWKAFEGTAAPIEFFSLNGYEGSYTATMRAIAGDVYLSEDEMYNDVNAGNINFSNNYYLQHPAEN